VVFSAFCAAIVGVNMSKKWLPSDFLAKIDFIAFSVRLGDTISKNHGVQIFPAVLLLWQQNAVSNTLIAAKIQLLSV